MIVLNTFNSPLVRNVVSGIIVAEKSEFNMLTDFMAG